MEFWREQCEQLPLTRKAVDSAMGQWIWGLAPWKIYSTFTFQDYHGQAPGIVKAREALDAVLDSHNEDWKAYAFMLQSGDITRRLHWHGLVYSDRPICRPSWRGFCAWEPVRSERSASYIARYNSKTALDFRIKRPQEVSHPLTGMV